MALLNTALILPSETIYSYVARLHGLWGESNYRNTASRWLGKHTASVDQKLPVGLAYLSTVTNIDPIKLLNEHTFFPIFAANSGDPQRLKRALLSNNGSPVGNLANVSQSGLSGFNASRYCPGCTEIDKNEYGVAYWHLEHQFTGVIACVRHGICLRCVETSPRIFCLPPQTDNIPRKIASSQAVRFAYQIVLHNQFYKPDSTEADEIYWLQPEMLVRQKNWAKGKNTDMNMLMGALRSASHHLFNDEHILSENVVRNLLHKPHYNCHPLKPVLLNFVLESLPEQPPKPVAKTTKCPKEELKVKKRCMGLLKAEQYSLREIARRVKRSVGFVRVLAGQLGIYYQRRTQFITPDIESRIVKLAIAGEARQSIAKKEGISVGAIEQIIQQTKGLSAYRQYIRMLDKREASRAALVAAIQSNPCATRNDIKGRLSAQYTWMYKYDKTWLYQILPPAVNKRNPTYNHGANHD